MPGALVGVASCARCGSLQSSAGVLCESCGTVLTPAALAVSNIASEAVPAGGSGTLSLTVANSGDASSTTVDQNLESRGGHLCHAA